MASNGQLKLEGGHNGNANPNNPKAEEVRAEIERAREQIATSVMALRREMAVRTDWREWVRRKPALFLAGAFALGFLIGTRR